MTGANLSDSSSTRACHGVLDAARDDGEEGNVGILLSHQLEAEKLNDTPNGGEGEEPPLLLPHPGPRPLNWGADAARQPTWENQALPITLLWEFLKVPFIIRIVK